MRVVEWAIWHLTAQDNTHNYSINLPQAAPTSSYLITK
jgi:hypothetical protein